MSSATAGALVGDYRWCCDAHGVEMEYHRGTIPSNQLGTGYQWLYFREAQERWGYVLPSDKRSCLNY